MNCEDVELELSAPAPSAEARAHLAGCASCQETARVLGLAALPPLSQAERLLLSGVVASTEEAWRTSRGRGELVRRVASLLIAAGLGALLASTVLLRTTPSAVTAEPLVQTVFLSTLEVPSFDDDASYLSDDEVFFDVGWPSLTEGEN